MTSRTVPHILIVDDDESVCRTLSAILQSEGYQTTAVATAKEATEKTKASFFDLALLDIKLPDMEGTQLLAQLQQISPKTIKIMVTGYPSLKNAAESLNLGADSYIMKPLDPAELLKIIRSKLEAQQQAEKITKGKLAEWVQSQVRKAQSSNFQEFLEETASELTDYGLTKTQAKIYIAITALGVASPSEIAGLSKIRREEVYRMIPELEEQEIITRKLKRPRRFSVIQPETAIQILMKNKIETMKEELEKLEQKQARLVSKLKTIELPTQQEKCSIDIVPKQSNLDNLFMKTINMTQNAEQQIDVIIPLETLKYAYLNCPEELKEKLRKTIRIRLITESHEPDAFAVEIKQYLGAANNRIEFRRVENLPFDLIIVDDNEAIWGKFAKNGDGPILWTNDPTNTKILRAAFESLWLSAPAGSYP